MTEKLEKAREAKKPSMSMKPVSMIEAIIGSIKGCSIEPIIEPTTGSALGFERVHPGSNSVRGKGASALVA
jgi:hypothetical protein